ncbi:putative peptide modification system cyclase [Xanthomonas sp. 4461]|uniref:putative peptide modification system cyclase n=1 Tax=Xanthomonas sp. 4461 TaxID=3035313 RepID=UPI002167C06C|nr:putative peptide modification system cyclase [Xanthomonas sp. 4461]MCS3811332.1 putative peptide modification system cyclase [Xanthomonas sp. 4461]
MSARTHARKDASSEAMQAPRLRTLLLTDLCDSTALVERIGDNAAAALFREHDRLVVKLQQQWRGRLIDRSDGLLLLFDRPIDGLGFALDYARGLKAMGDAHALTLCARQGLHVGEVLTWRNSEEAVSIGAKPLEVEGLAKPTAARLMSMARPGQILISAVAESLTHRAARELGDRAERILWKSHGRWRFKGVPTPMEIYEVGEVGLTPLRMPKNSAKAWRDVPLWRRPAALVAETGVMLAVGIAIWFFIRPQPAIAFSERDWVVVGDLQNALKDSRYQGAVEAALRTSIEQSRYINVVPAERAQNVLAMMGKPDQSMDRRVGSEISERLGARALLLPTISEVAGNIRIDLEVVNPRTSATVLSLSASGKGADSVVASIGDVGAALRKSLGEQPELIERSSLPLEKVTTQNIDALRSFTLGQKAYALKDLGAAEQYFAISLKLDPSFAMARIALARVAYSRTDVARAQEGMQHALDGVPRLTNRERLYADAQLSLFSGEKGYVQKWKALSDLYPDFDVAAFNTASGMRLANDYAGMAKYSQRAASPQAVTLPLAMQYRAMANMGLGRLDLASADCLASKRIGFKYNSVECALIKAASRSPNEALVELRPVAKEERFLSVARAAAEVTVLADAGRWSEAATGAKALMTMIESPKLPYDWLARTTSLAVVAHEDDQAARLSGARELFRLAKKSVEGTNGRTRECILVAALYSAYVAVGEGDSSLAVEALPLAAKDEESSPFSTLGNLSAILKARMETNSGRPAHALSLLEAYSEPAALSLTEVERVRARRALGKMVSQSVDNVAEIKKRARIYAEWLPDRPPIIDSLLPR